MAKLKIKKGDKVKVIAGNYKGTEGTVLKVLPKDNKAIVEKVRIVKKHVKPSASNPNGGIVETEAPIDISNLIYIDSEGNTSRLGRKVVDGKVKRFVKKTDKIIE